MSCLKCFYLMQVIPDSCGNANIYACHFNRYLPGNAFVVKKDLAAAWNARPLQFQRQMALNNDQSRCFGAHCSVHLFQMPDENKMTASNGCVPRAVQHRQLKLDYFPLVMEVYPSLECNNRCVFCFHGKDDASDGKFRLRQHFIQEFKDVFFTRAEWIILNGGEPLFSQGGRDLLEWLLASGLKKRIILKTNGVLLEQFGIERLAAKGVEMQISLLGMNRDTYRKTAGADNFGRVMGAVEKFLSLGAGHLLGFSFIVCDENVQDAEAFGYFIERHPQFRGILWNEMFHGAKHWGLISQLQKKFSHLYPRLQFHYMDNNFRRRLWRARYWPLHWLKYRAFNPQTCVTCALPGAGNVA